MKELLLQKSKEWTYEDALKFHGGSELFNDYIWEWSEDGAGVYLTLPNAAYYLDNRSGCVYRVHTRYNIDDYDVLAKLANFYHDEIRFDRPIEHDWHIDENGTTWEYTVYRRPNKELGDPFILRVVSGNIDEHLTKYIQLTRDTIELFIDLGLENKFPRIGFTLVHLNIDSLGPFWMNLKTFEIGYDEVVEKTLKEFRRDLYSLSQAFNMDMSSYITAAEKSWQLTT